MARLVWAVFCRKALNDAQSGELSLIDVIETIHINSSELPTIDGHAPALPMASVLASYWVRSNASKPETAEVRFTMIAPSGKEVAPSVSNVIELQAARAHRVMLNVPQLPVPEGGLHTFRIELKKGRKWEIVGEAPWEIKFVAEVPATESS